MQKPSVRMWSWCTGCLCGHTPQVCMADSPFIFSALGLRGEQWEDQAFFVCISLEEIILDCHRFRGFRRCTDGGTTLGGVFCRSFPMVGQQSSEGESQVT